LTKPGQATVLSHHKRLPAVACYHFGGFAEGQMEETWIGILGTTGTILSTFSLLPQVIHTWRTQSATGISIIWLTVALVSMLIWIGYGFLIRAPAVVLVNVLCFLQCSYILFVKLQSERAPLAERR
jgi:MtN3 and saliva related transmembrane protein